MYESLPNPVTELCIARASKFDYPAISMTSPAFRRLIASPQLYHTRSKLAVTEHFLYAMIRLPPCQFPRWYLLSQTSLQLRLIGTLPLMPLGSAVVTIGPDIYVIGGRYGNTTNTNTSDLLRIDCRTHTCDRSLPKMKVARFCAAVPSSNWVEVFDPKTRTWLGWTVPGLIMSNVNMYAVFEEKIYVCHSLGWNAYDIKLGQWYIWLGKIRLWRESCCVVDDLLFYIDPARTLGHIIVVYDPKVGAWRPLNLGESPIVLPPHLHYNESKLASFGGRLVILVGNERDEIWCIKIAFERRHGGWIWGMVESADVVLETTMKSSPSVDLCRALTI